VTVYTRSDVVSVFVGPTGHTHALSKKAKEAQGITCAECEPHLLEMGGWVRSPAAVELTPDEIREAEFEEKQIQNFERQTVAENARNAAASVRAGRGVQ